MTVLPLKFVFESKKKTESNIFLYLFYFIIFSIFPPTGAETEILAGLSGECQGLAAEPLETITTFEDLCANTK